MTSLSLIDQYIQAATEHGIGTEEGNADQANRAFDRLTELFAQISETGLRRELLPLLENEDPAVRLHSAFHLLSVNPELAERVLEEVARGPGLIGFSAQMTLSQWRSGQLDVP